MGASSPRVLMPYDGDPFAGAGAPGRHAQHAAAGQRRPVEVAQRHVLGHAEGADAGVAQRLLGQAAHLEAVVLGPAGAVRLARHLHAAAGARPLADQRLDQLALAVAADAGHAQDLALVDGEVQPLHGQRAAVALDLQPLHDQGGSTGPGLALLRRGGGRRLVGRPAVAHHGLRQPGRRGLRDGAVVHLAATAQHRDVVGIGGDLAELVRDEQDGAAAGAREVAHVAQHLVGLLRCQHRGGLVQDQQARLQVQLLEQLQLLLLAGGQPGRRGIQVEPERRGRQEGLELRALRPPVDHGGRAAAGQQQVLGHRHARRQREVLVDHADAQRARDDRIGDVLLAAVDQDAAGLGAVEAGDALDQRALAGAVLAQQRMHGARRRLERDAVQRREAPKRLVSV
jgi:hypothetical protein